MRYRRSNTKGGTFFFTVNLADRTSDLLVRHADILRTVMHKVKSDHPFEITAMVVLPDHLHAIWTLPDRDRDYPVRWSLIKAGFSRAITKTEHINTSRQHKRERGIWQRRYWEHEIRNDLDLSRHVDYIHINPVKHGYVTTASAWPYSSIHRYIREGLIPETWAADVNCNHTDYGDNE